MFVRKLMDLCFTKKELSWLDDLMPESKKKTEDDEKIKEKEVSVKTEHVVNFQEIPNAI